MGHGLGIIYNNELNELEYLNRSFDGHVVDPDTAASPRAILVARCAGVTVSSVYKSWLEEARLKLEHLGCALRS